MTDKRLRDAEREWLAHGGDPTRYDEAYRRADLPGASPPRRQTLDQLKALLRHHAIRRLREHVGLGCSLYEAELVLHHFITIAPEVPSDQMLSELVLGIRLHRLGLRMRGAQAEVLDSIVSVQPMSTPPGVIAFLDAMTNTERAEALESFFPTASEGLDG